MPFHFSQFLSASSDADLQRKVSALPSFSGELRHCLVTGPERRCDMHLPCMLQSRADLNTLFRDTFHATDTLVFYRPCSGRTALLFHYAHSRAAAGETVVFITRRESVESELPVLPAGVTKEAEAFVRIQMRRVPSLC